MKTRLFLAIALSIVGSSLALHGTQAQQAGIKRTDLQRHDLSVPGREAIQVRVDFDPGAAFGKHTHPGEEIIYVLDGSLEYEVEGNRSIRRSRANACSYPCRCYTSASSTSRSTSPTCRSCSETLCSDSGDAI